MDDLISRKEAINAAKGKSEYTDVIFDKATESEIVYMLRCLPTVEAVPLEPLCVWLAGYAAPPQYAMDHVYDMNILNGPSERYEAWKYHFRELLKSGLMDTEESNAENK